MPRDNWAKLMKELEAAAAATDDLDITSTQDKPKPESVLREWSTPELPPEDSVVGHDLSGELPGDSVGQHPITEPPPALKLAMAQSQLAEPAPSKFEEQATAHVEPPEHVEPPAPVEPTSPVEPPAPVSPRTGPVISHAPASTSPSHEALSDLWMPEDEPASPAGDLADRLLAAGEIDASQQANARTLASKTTGKTLADIFFEMGVNEEAIQNNVAELAGVGFERLTLQNVDTGLIERLTLDFCKANHVLPLRMLGSRLLLGVTHPDNLILIDEVRHKLGLAIKPVVICRKDVVAIIESVTQDQNPNDSAAVEEIIAGIQVDDIEVVKAKDEDVNLEKMAGESPVIRFVNYMIFNAVKEGASDIHIEPQEKKLRVRYRIDGVLFEMLNPPQHMHAAIISRLKIMANLDISERRLPQDGRIRANIHGRKLDLRLSTLPTAVGEKAVMRILDNRSIQVPLDALGMDIDQLTMWKNQIDQPHGIMLVTGPTGSGKTTTLYASLAQMDTNELNVSTVEDPVEYHLAGISQVQVHEKIGMSFSAALRSLLRQDPDVIMVGEIRDAETARIAIQASLTGHLVLSTLHTNDAPSSITRLINIGVEPYLLGAAINGVLAQRLVRKVCQHCRKQVAPNPQVAEHLAMHGVAMDQVWVGAGCERCRSTGYSGRLGIYELLVLDDMLRDRVTGSPSVTEFRRLCVERGMVTLREDGFRKVGKGLTTVDEVLRVTEATI